MPEKALVTRELAKLFGALSHPDRIRIIEELGNHRELDVQSLQELLKVSHSRVSQHLAILRSHHLVAERREGRHHYYHLESAELAVWILNGLKFTEGEMLDPGLLQEAIQQARRLWGPSDK